MSETFEKELQTLLNRHSEENASNTPDFILAAYLKDCLDTWNRAIEWREDWYGRGPQSISTPDDAAARRQQEGK